MRGSQVQGANGLSPYPSFPAEVVTWVDYLAAEQLSNASPGQWPVGWSAAAAATGHPHAGSLEVELGLVVQGV